MRTEAQVTVEEWAGRGDWLDLDMGRIFVIDIPATAPPGSSPEPVLVLHGFPSCSFDWRHVLDALVDSGRRVVLFDFLGFGLSDKPDRRYSIEMHADTAEAVCAALGLARVALVTHDMGDSVGGELLARSLDEARSSSTLEVTRRVLSNGSIYLGLAQLTDGQQLLLSLDDAKIGPELAGAVGAESFSRGLGLVFSPGHPASAGELAAQALLAGTQDGLLLLPRLIRYIEDRRRSESRYTGAIESHPAPLSVIWGVVDPVAKVEMADRLAERRRDAIVTRLDGVGHYPMIEDPAAFGVALASALVR